MNVPKHNRFIEFRFGWQVVVASAFGIALGLSPLPFYTLGLFIEPYANEFGWTRDVVLSAFTVFTISAVFLAPLVGFLADKFGVRRVVLISIPGLSLGLMLMAFNNGSYALYLCLWAVLAALGVGTLPITFTRAVNRWFHDCRGLALGIALIGTGLSGFLAKIYVGYLIPTVGWQGAYIGLGLLPLLISLPINLFLFRDIDDKKVRDRAKALAAHRQSEVSMRPGGLTLRQACKDWRLWLLAYSFLPLSFIIGGPIPGIENVMTTQGFSTEQALTLGYALPLSVVVGRLVGGYMIDHIWAPAVAVVVLSLPIFFCAILRMDDPSYALALLGNVSLGLAAGVEYDLLAFLVSRYFGMRSYATIYGVMYAIFALGAGFGPWLYGLSAERTGSYDFILGIALFVIPFVTIPLLALGKYRDFPPDPEPIADGTPAMQATS
ncbi:MAG: MFS transporter [Pseudomonadota bacterium]